MSFRVTLEGVDDLRDALKRVDEITSRSLSKATHVGLEEARVLATQLARVRTGAMRDGIVARLLSASARNTIGELVARAPYASFVEGGTRAHDIFPKGGKMLRWFVNGAPRFARHVRHPGTTAHPFIGPAALKWESVAVRELEVGIANAQEVLNAQRT